MKDLNNRLVHYSDHGHLSGNQTVWYSSHKFLFYQIRNHALGLHGGQVG